MNNNTFSSVDPDDVSPTAKVRTRLTVKRETLAVLRVRTSLRAGDTSCKYSGGPPTQDMKQ